MADEPSLPLRGEGPTPARRVSWSPGAEGAAADREERWLKVLLWESAGTMRRDILAARITDFR